MGKYVTTNFFPYNPSFRLPRAAGADPRTVADHLRSHPCAGFAEAVSFP